MLKTPTPVDTSGVRLWRDFAAFVSAYILIFIVLCPGTRFIATPANHDDFSNLGHAAYMWYAWRPVSYTVLLTLSQLGTSVYYSALHVLVIVYAFLSMCVLRRLLDTRGVPLIALLPVAAAMLGYEHIVEYSRYTGLITNLLSGVFAFCAMALMTARTGATSPSLSFSVIAIVWLFSALSFW